ncbi:MAG: STAS domain-containing protein [Armatimonadota bacterium]
MNNKLNINTTTNNGVKIIHVAGEVDLYTVDSLQQVINRCLDSGARQLIIDLTETSYLDSSGLSALLMAYKILSSRSGVLYVVISKSKPAVGRVLEITRLDMVFKIFDSLEEALNDIKISQAA